MSDSHRDNPEFADAIADALDRIHDEEDDSLILQQQAYLDDAHVEKRRKFASPANVIPFHQGGDNIDAMARALWDACRELGVETLSEHGAWSQTAGWYRQIAERQAYWMDANARPAPGGSAA